MVQKAMTFQNFPHLTLLVIFSYIHVNFKSLYILGLFLIKNVILD